MRGRRHRPARRDRPRRHRDRLSSRGPPRTSAPRQGAVRYLDRWRREQQPTQSHNRPAYWGQERIAELIKRQQTFYNWQFIFLAANQDAFKVGAAYGFQVVNTISYGADAAGARGSYNAMSGTVSALRSTGALKNFTDAERVASSGTTGAAWDSTTGTYADQAGFAGKAA